MQRYLLALLMMSSCCGAFAAQATVIRSSQLRAKPFIDAPVTATLAEQAEVTILSADGGWNEVRTKEGSKGWIRMLSLRAKAGETGGLSLKGLGELGNVARTGTTGSSATTGAKGISKEDLAAATPNEAELKKLEGYRVGQKEAQQYANQNKLKAREVDIPAKPAKS